MHFSEDSTDGTKSPEDKAPTPTSLPPAGSTKFEVPQPKQAGGRNGPAGAPERPASPTVSPSAVGIELGLSEEDGSVHNGRHFRLMNNRPWRTLEGKQVNPMFEGRRDTALQRANSQGSTQLSGREGAAAAAAGGDASSVVSGASSGAAPEDEEGSACFHEVEMKTVVDPVSSRWVTVGMAFGHSV